MESFSIILGLVVVGAITILIILQKVGKIKDVNGNLIPDAIENKVETAKKVVTEVKSRAKKVAKETKEVVEATKKVVKEAKDVVDAVKGIDKPKVKRSRTPKTNK
jgi:hypothetical protein